MLDPGNPFATVSTLDYQLPPFDQIREEHYLPAIAAGMAEQLEEIAAIRDDAGTPTFGNTVEAFERSGSLLNRATLVFYNLANSDSTDRMQDIETTVAPLLAAHSDTIHLDGALFARFEHVHTHRDTLGLSDEQLRVLDRYHRDFLRAGAALSEDQKTLLRQYNTELSALTTAFGNQLLAETNDLAVLVEDESELAGLSAAEIASARLSAAARGLQDGYLIPLISPTRQPALSSLHNRELRKRIHLAATTRGLRGNDHDTRALIAQIVRLRAQRAALFGFADHASYVVDDQTAGTVKAVITMLDRLAAPAAANARAEAEELQAALIDDGIEGQLEAWDWAYYAEKVKAKKFDVDEAALRPYFELNRVLHDGVFFAAEQLYGLTFTARDDLPRYHPEARTYEVHDSAGAALGLFIADWHTRDSKRGGAWMSEFVEQSGLLGTRPVTVVNLNIPRPPDGQPALMTSDEVNTAFHEFGHALHGLMSQVYYPRVAGTNVPRDFVEFPSQVNEMWALWPEILANYAVHTETGERLSQELADKLIAARGYGEGFATTEALASALLDHEWHRVTEDEQIEPTDIASFELAALKKHGMDVDGVPPRYHSTYFQHIFTNGYDAGYYSYIWSEVLDADIVEWFKENGGLRRENGDIFRERLLSVGSSVDPLEAFAAVRGRAPDVQPLLVRRGLTGGAS